MFSALSMVDGWMVFYVAFNSILVISRQQFKLFMSFLGFTSTRLGLWSVLPKDTPTKKPRGSSEARSQDPWITRQTLYHWAMQDPFCSIKENCTISGTLKLSSANAFNLDKAKILSAGKVLTLYQATKFYTGPNWKLLQFDKRKNYMLPAIFSKAFY